MASCKSQNGDVTVWDPKNLGLEKGRFDKRPGARRPIVHPFTRRSEAVSTFVFGAAPKPLSGGLAFWSIPNGELIKPSWEYDNVSAFASLCVSPDDRHLYACNDKELWIWDLQKDSKEPRKVQAHGGHTYSMAISPDGRSLVTAKNGELIHWEVPKGKRHRLFQQLGITETDVGQVLAFAPDSWHVAAACANGRVLILRLSQSKIP